MSDADGITGHGIYIAGNFEIEEKISAEQSQRETQYRTYVLSIPCSGVDGCRRYSYEIKAIGYSGKDVKLKAKNVCYLRGAFFPCNSLDTKADQLFFKASDRAVITNGEAFPYSLVDTVGMTGLGRVLKIDEVVEASIQHLIPKNPGKDKITTIVTLEHSDYHPETKAPKVSRVEYHICPFPHLAGSFKVVKKGRELLFHGYIKDLNEETGCYIVIVNRVSPTSGHVEESEMSGLANAKASTNGGVDSIVNPLKPVKFKPRPVSSPFKSPLISSDSKSNMAFPPSEFTETSFSSASSVLLASSSKKNLANLDTDQEEQVTAKKTKSRPPPKPKTSSASAANKRPRAPRARRGATSEQVLEIGSDD